MGAAVQGHILAMGDARTGGADLAGTTDLLLLDVTPLSLGIELEGREMSVLIKRNTTIPCRKSRTYTTVEDWQTSIDVVVYEVRFLSPVRCRWHVYRINMFAKLAKIRYARES